MDKLEPILKHKYWILFGLALILPFVGWFMGTGTLKEEIAKRESDIDAAFSAAQSVSPASPNQTFVDGIKQVSLKQKEEYVAAQEDLFETQQSLQVWPPNVQNYIDRMMPDLKYRDTLIGRTPDLYRTEYKEYVRDEIVPEVKPFHVPKGVSKAKFDQQNMSFGKVVVNWSGIPFVDQQLWVQNPPTSKEMWDAQEDLWLIRSLFQAIAKTNDVASSIVQSPIKELDLLELRGGNAAEIAAREAGGGEVAAVDAMPDDASSDFELSPGLGGFGGGGELGGNQAPGSVSINLEVDFGSDAETAVAADDPNAVPDGVGLDPGGLVGFDAGAGGTREGRRYIEDGATVPYQTRGFYMILTMDHREVPRFVTELQNSKWPVRITRIHQSDLDQNTIATRDDGDFDGGENFTETPTAPVFGGAGRPRFGAQPMAGGGAAGATRFSADPFADATRTRETFYQDYQKLLVEAQSTYNKAMREPYLAKIAIAGWMTLYREPQEEELAEGEQPAEDPNAAPTDPTAVDPETGEPLAADPNAVDPATTDPTADPTAVDPATGDPTATDPGAALPMLDPKTGLPITPDPMSDPDPMSEPDPSPMPPDSALPGDPAAPEENPIPTPATDPDVDPAADPAGT